MHDPQGHDGISMTALHEWFRTPPGQSVLAWERAQFDALLADVFGYHALQLGLPDIDALAANRMPHRWLARVALSRDDPAASAALVTDSGALPFAEASLDLVVLPHTLEFSADPHASLREVRRVLVPEGRVAITGFNPLSLWGWRQQRARWLGGRPYLPEMGEFIGPGRLRDWLRLLEFEVESLGFGCYQPAVFGAGALARFGWLERLGRRWWPILGATYCVVAVKRVPGALLIGQTWRKAAKPVRAPASIAGRVAPQPNSMERELESH